MKKLIVLCSGLIIAAGAAAQTERTTPAAVQSGQTGKPVATDKTERKNAFQESVESANAVDPDFQGSSKQETTSSGMGQPKTDTDKKSNASKPTSDAQDVEDKTKK